ncbi:ErfK/YbiS/YcfS/YnhG family protein [Pseudooceanicola batsensis HTCC2597]|uniref:ErfK/YbiS/YcfS/YnhG family protein n=1 Tax=Pseudooceanicola batsensis (strain ATCC BAA-863 / DSM 15984 / KCTC 12145 / HTCC2597) TaxID=252305 RepID=A3TWN2_PSEBH|nr:L,D-transpeptidase family protein [Pseudooceanicola batsensis]EAQ04028.1 ErfK/YbiS/YcfS/YnhG family protein [Pseudooceanicola batsensis HTCC2597]
MRFLSLILMIAIGLGLSGCASKFKTYYGPEVTQVLVYKADRRMYLMHHDEVLKSYRIGLGFAPVGHKQFEGDGRTPEGTYRIDRRNPDSEFHLSVGLSYPNTRDVAFATSQGKSPGGDIFIHGLPNRFKKSGSRDWTAGCIAVRNHEIEDIYAMVKDGTLITIHP